MLSKSIPLSSSIWNKIVWFYIGYQYAKQEEIAILTLSFGWSFKNLESIRAPSSPEVKITLDTIYLSTLPS